MSFLERISDNLNRAASGTSRRRVHHEEEARLLHHGGPARELYERSKAFADEIERIALQIEADL